MKAALVPTFLSLLLTAGALAAAPQPRGLYRGHNSEGARASLRVSPHGRRATLNAGSVLVDCSGTDPDREEPTSVADYLRIRRGRFAMEAVFFTSGNAGSVRGRFVSRRHVTGRVAITTRDDCFGRATFSLRLTAR